MSFSFTEGQKRAIETRGRSLLVSAAAGSGKTCVLTERVLRYITDPLENEDIDRFLIITYTRAAAGEMRSRIMDAIAEAAAANPADRRLRRQQDKCYQAPIGTIHSFCTALLRENCHLIGLPPAFKVIDEDRAEKTKQSLCESLLESRYEHLDRHSGFKALSDSVGAGRDDRRLAETLLRLYEKIRSHPYPEDWIAEQKALLRALPEIRDAADTVWGKVLLQDIQDSASYWAERMDQAVLEIYNADDKIISAYGEVFMEDAAALRDFVRALDIGWDKAREFLPPEKFRALGRLVRYENTELKDRVTAVRNAYKKAAEGFRKALESSSEKQLEEMKLASPAMEALLDLCSDFDRLYAAEKRREGLVDFSDLEHMSCGILVDKASGEPSALARELSRRYREIMVDEYQDVNAVQDMIFRALSRSGKNLFMVGDVKQSIYRFRLADPTIFLDKYESYADYGCAEAEDEPLRILLQENFRSRKAVLDAANQVFFNIMSTRLGELDYDGDAALRFGSKAYPEGSDCPAELCLIDPARGEDGEESPEKAAIEARFIAKRIKAMMDAGTPVHDKDGVRPCRWSDFVLLMRSPGGKGSIFHTELSRAGIPVQSRQAGGFFSSIEVGVAIDMLTVIDNPHSDVALISVLRSPAFGFSADALSAIRAADKRSDFYTALLAAAENGDERCRDFAEKLSAIRAAAPDLSLDALLWRVYTETELFAVCSAMSGGEERRANLMSLFQLARSFEESGYRGLFRFVAWLRRMAESGREPQRSGDGDFVSIMSIHKSKGLEFPFVFLCDLGHSFNKLDERAHVLLHSRLGLGPKITDTARGIEYPGLAHRAIAKQIDTETLSEEMRVLYVGMTRAKEQLIMSSIFENPENRLAKMRLNAASPMPPAVLRGCSAPVHWLTYAAMTDENGFIDMKVVSPEDSGDEIPISAARSEAADYDSAVLDALRKNLSFVYPHQAATELPTKVSATALKEYEDENDLEAAVLVWESPEFEFRRPRFGDEKARRLSAAEFGTATHAFLQYVDLSNTASLTLLEEERHRLETAGLLTSEEARAIDCRALLKFFQSSTGALLRKGKVHREFRFTLLSDASECFGAEAEGEEILLQGIIDCLVEEEDCLSIIDYKTDRICAEEADERAKRYQSQLWAYARSAERIFGKKVRNVIVHFLRPGVSIEV